MRNSCQKALIVIIRAGGFSNTTAIQESFDITNVFITKVGNTTSPDSCFFALLMPLFFLFFVLLIAVIKCNGSFLSKIFCLVNASVNRLYVCYFKEPSYKGIQYLHRLLEKKMYCDF